MDVNVCTLYTRACVCMYVAWLYVSIWWCVYMYEIEKYNKSAKVYGTQVHGGVCVSVCVCVLYQQRWNEIEVK